MAAVTGCGSSSKETKAETKAETSAETTAETGEETSGTAEAGTKLTVAASPTPHAEILNAAKELMAEKGIELEVIEFTDYVQPNKVVDAGAVSYTHLDVYKRQAWKVLLRQRTRLCRLLLFRQQQVQLLR